MQFYMQSATEIGHIDVEICYRNPLTSAERG